MKYAEEHKIQSIFCSFKNQPGQLKWRIFEKADLISSHTVLMHVALKNKILLNPRMPSIK